MIAVDAMGGDFAPASVVRGVLSFAKRKKLFKDPNNHDSIALFGPSRLIEDLLYSIDKSWQKYKILVCDSSDVIGMGDEPILSIKNKKNSSLVRAISSVAKGDYKVALSAGNSGAFMVAATLIIGRLAGVNRPALVGIIPGKSRGVVFLDLGANSDCKSINLYQFAHLGVRYAMDRFSIDSPRVGLLSVGQEDSKGSLLSREAFVLIKNSGLNFYGNIEPMHVFENRVDVVVTDGFSGNIFLKTFEAVASISRDLSLSIKRESGAFLIGVKKPAVLAHGNASSEDIDRALVFSWEIASKFVVENYVL